MDRLLQVYIAIFLLGRLAAVALLERRVFSSHGFAWISR
jgi:hypothetical protein